MPTVAHAAELSPEEIRKLEFEAYHDTIWEGAMSEILVDKDAIKGGVNQESVNVTKPIIKVRDLEGAGGDTVMSPLALQLDATAVWGDADESGVAAVDTSLYPAVCYVNAIFAATPSKVGPMNSQRFQKAASGFEERELAKRQIRRWFSRWLSRYAITYPFYYRYSAHVANQTDPATLTGGLNKGKVLHPQIHVAGSVSANTTEGWVDWHATAATYKARAAVAAAAMDAEGVTANNALSAYLLDKLNTQMADKNLKWDYPNPHMEDCLAILCHPEAFAQARRDPEINRATQSAWRGGMFKDPIIKGDSLYYNGFLLINSREAGVSVHSENGTTDLVFGPVAADGTTELDWTQNYQSTTAAMRNLKANIILGANALLLAQVGSMETTFHSGARSKLRYEALHAQMVVGASRADYVDNVATPTAIKPQGSAILITNSPAL